ncbi:sugar ABC transporter substrate-binding protein [Kribbella sandramycini]|uniref:Multiple sugar transport system substrate-binding protein n=1 Tax=Kribbella sandramycini TaxID=60450 RepID=A0A7Y4NY17_9ACTN|nr:sugar ABC transporter substrate-binding protein [Kribbella sandramycini]MBB6567331.1 multiple sugar transport system substrate-binding protein [Kribbella sandramycini]NOL40056.1 sugar ABC transporter substrate-binding protein [Kribbella sandramycini]
MTGFSRRQVLTVGGGLAALAVAGCGSNTGRPADSGGGKATLSQWYHQYGEAGTQQAVQRYAKEYPDATVTIDWSPGDYDKKVSTTLLTDQGPDVFEYGNGPTIDMIKGGQVVDLSELPGDAKADFTPSLIARMSYQGKLYAIPQVTDMQLLVYRKSLLSAAGLQPPQTFDELFDAAKKLTTDKVKGLFVGNDGGVGILGGPALWSAGLDYLTEDGKFGFDDPLAAEALKKLRELFTSKTLLLGAPTDWSDPAAFTQGLTAMQFTGLWTLPAIEKALKDDFGVLPWPKLNATTGAPSVPVGAYGACVNAKSKNVDAAKKFVKWLWVDQTDKQLDFAQSYGFHIPARKSLAAKAEKLKSGVGADAVKFVNENGHAQSPVLWSPKSGTAYTDALNRIIRSGSDPATEIKAVKSVVEAELKRIAG